MARDDLISAYLSEVGSSLRGEGRASARILAEIEDHLRESAERYALTGLALRQAQHRAVAAFGDPGQLALAFRSADEGGWLMAQFVRFGGLLGIAGPVAAAAGVIAWSWWTYAAAMALLVVSAIAMVAAQPRGVRRISGLCLAAVPAGLAIAAYSEPAAKLVLAAGLMGFAVSMLEGRVLPRVAVLSMAGGMSIFGAGVALGIAELPMSLQGLAFALIAAGWMWSGWSMWRSGQDRSTVPPEPAGA